MNQIQPLEAALNRNGRSLRNFTSILDFGCGHGRLSQHLCWLMPDAQLYGCDLDPMGVAEAQRACPRGHFYTNKVTPPLEFEDGQFDLVLCWSVFTNISEWSHQIWLRELARVLQPGGVMLNTTHSHEYLRRISVFSPESLAKFNFQGSIDEFIESGKGFHYVSPPHWPADYGWAIISKEYVTSKWPDYSGLSLVNYSEAAFETYPEGCQDIVILAKSPV
jgi:SAM-dependent methyltransferase